MISPRRTTLIRTPDLAGFRAALVRRVDGLPAASAAHAFVLVPSAAAGEQLRRTIEDHVLTVERPAIVLPQMGTRAALYQALASRLPQAARELSSFEREVILTSAARSAEARGIVPPFRLRPGLVAAMLELYDHIRRLGRSIADFERNFRVELEPAAAFDRGAERLLQQTVFLHAVFEDYQTRVRDRGVLDEHVLRGRLLAVPSDRPLTDIVVTVGDRQSDPDGLWPADFDLLARVPGLERLDLVATEGLLTAGLLGRLHAAFPGIEEVRAGEPARSQHHFAPPAHPNALDHARWGPRAPAGPRLLVPPPGPGRESRSTFVSRDREEELVAIARRVKAEQRQPGAPPLDRVALVVHRPLPYLYLARDVFVGAGIPFETLDTLPLAAEPYAAAVDLVLEWVISDFTRPATIALLRSPHFDFGTAKAAPSDPGTPKGVPSIDGSTSATAALDVARDAEAVPSIRDVSGGHIRAVNGGHRFSGAGMHEISTSATAALDVARDAQAMPSIRDVSGGHIRAVNGGHRFSGAGMNEISTSATAALDVALAEARYLGGLARLRTLLESLDIPAARMAQAAADRIAPLAEPRPMVDQIECLLAFLEMFDRPSSAEVEGRRQRVRGAVVDALVELSSAYRTYDATATADAAALSAAVRRWLGARTFAARTGKSGLQIVDAQAARYGTFVDVQLVGLIDGEWPERPRRPVFFPATLMNLLEPVSADPDRRERDAVQAARAAFVDLLHLSRGTVRVSTVLLENDAVVEPSMLLDEVAAAGLTRSTEPPVPAARIFQHEAVTLAPHAIDALPNPAAQWARARTAARDADLSRFRGAIGAWRPRRISVSRLERYLDCPFRFFSSEVLALEEEPEDEDTRTPLERGRFLHELFEGFFAEWQRRGHRRLDVGNVDEARTVFREVCERKLASLSPSEAALERVRLEGSAVSPGIAHRVFEMEAERSEIILERLLEYPFEGEFTFHREDGESRTIALRGKADRIDLLENGTIRVIDYKSKKTPDLKQALQLPVYSLCARERLQGYRGRAWTIGEAAYLSFEGEKAVVPLKQRDVPLEQIITAAEDRLLSTLDAIEAGVFPPRPAKKSLCTMCAFSAVCRKEWVEVEDE